MKKLNLVLSVLSLFIVLSCDNDECEVSNMKEVINSQTRSKVTLPSGIVVEKVGKNYFWQGDILLSNEQLRQLSEYGSFMPTAAIENSSTERISPTSGMTATESSIKQTRCTGVYPNGYNLWAMVRYKINPNISYFTRLLIRQAISHWESRTNVRFYNATGLDSIDATYGFKYPCIEFYNGDGNFSSIGRINQPQFISIFAMEDRYMAVAHEIGHAIGLYHEQCRYDRDQYININFSNLDTSVLPVHNFTKVTTNYYCIGSFDWDSIMLYGSFDGSIYGDDGVSSHAVMTKKTDNSTWGTLTDSRPLSDLDRRWANTFYLPYIARSDTYAELDSVVYDSNNIRLTEEQRISLQASLNNGNPTPPVNGRIPSNN